ncbi:MAG TPA: O-antigen ligase family protein [Sphingomicrobium sp.]|nr:O-antigen ligase family protein [Sphingomicrobium sp.]
MPSRSRALVAPAYLFACLVLGGSAQGIWQNMLLQLAGLAILGWAALDKGEEPVARPARQLLMIAIAGLTLVALQMIPLPPDVWTHLGPRAKVAEGFQALGVAVPWEPLSLAPASGVDALLRTIPPLALLCAMVRLRAFRRQWLAVALVAGTLAGVLLGALQVASADPLTSPWYLYDETNWGKAVGFFANADHMATLLVAAIPFTAAIVAAAGGRSFQRRAALLATGAAIALVLVVGVALNGSLAGYGLAPAALAASALILLPRRSRLRSWVVALTAIFLAAAVAALEVTPIGSGHVGEHARSAVDSRSEILATTSRAAADFMPFGSGLGSFRSVYRLYERPEQVTATYVVHAHNDFAELALELGVAGIVLMLLFLAWWAAAVWRAWSSAEAGPFSRAAAVASGAILVHSLVDFPLRTAAVGACFAMCLALLAGSRSVRRAESNELRPTRHVVI